MKPYLMQELSPELDGSLGSNRSEQPCFLGAKTDQQALLAWLGQYLGNANTLSAYRKEAERLGLWALLCLRKPISSLTAEDFEAYAGFLLNPSPRELWQSPAGGRKGRKDPDWRPFQGPLSPQAQRQALIILNSCMAWLVSARYLAGNPLSLSRRPRQRTSLKVERYLERPLWDYLKEYVEGLAQESDRDRAHAQRLRWVLSLFYLGGLRISDIVDNGMSAFRCRAQPDGSVLWWLRLLGKGNTLAEIPATPELIEELVRYREALGASSYPSENDDLPLVASIGPQRKGLTRSALHLIVKEMFRGAAQGLRDRGGPSEALADRLETASAHWLRHTAGSHMMAATQDVVLVRDVLRHADASTTHGYLHAEQNLMHEALSDAHQIGWGLSSPLPPKGQKKKPSS